MARRNGDTAADIAEQSRLAGEMPERSLCTDAGLLASINQCA